MYCSNKKISLLSFYWVTVIYLLAANLLSNYLFSLAHKLESLIYIYMLPMWIEHSSGKIYWLLHTLKCQ